MNRTLIVYDSKYGSTEQVAKIICQIIGPARCCRTYEFKNEYKDFDSIVIGAPVYNEMISKNIMNFVNDNCEWLMYKKVAIFCTCLNLKEGVKYLAPIKNILKNNIVWTGALGGRVHLNLIDRTECNSVKKIYFQRQLPYKDMDMINLNQIVDASLQIKQLLDIPKKCLSNQVLESDIEDFLKKHNTCTLSTGYDMKVRGTPIEYIYLDQYIYMLSEGGIKFANILLNKNVSISVYDTYKGMNNLGGIQIEGNAEIIDINNEEYIKVMQHKGINLDKILKLPINMNMIRVKPKMAEFLWSDYGKQGFDVKQYYEFGQL